MPKGKGTYGTVKGRPTVKPKKRVVVRQTPKNLKEDTPDGSYCSPEKALARHKEHHTAKHMTEMRKLMRDGKTFTQSHKTAMKKVGK